MFFGISGSEFLVIVLVAVIVVGPHRLPEYTRKLTRMVRRLRVFLDNARSQIAEEVGPEMADLDLSSLDPRQYDPRKIVRDALGEDIDAIREDLAHPFKSVGSAAKEASDDAAKAVNDVVQQDRAKSLSKQIEAKRAEQRSEKDGANSAADDTESNTGNDTESNTGNSTVQEETSEAAKEPETLVASQGALQASDSAEPEAEPEPAESTDQAEPEAVEAERSEESEPSESGEEPVEPEPMEIPASLADTRGAAAGEHPKDASEAADAPGRVRPLSPRDIVRAANAAARTRAEAARIAVDF